MSDGSATWGGTDAATSRSPGRPRLIAAGAAGLLLLSAIGAIGGWLLADPGRDNPSKNAGGVASGSPTPALTSVTPSRAATAPVTASPVRPSAATERPQSGQFVLPDMVGVDFEPARRQMRALGLGVQLVFAASGDDRGVERTEPAGGVMVRRGVTVKVHVGGAAPAATVPSVTGVSCADAAALVVDHGLYPEYPTGRSGRVVRQDPDPSGERQWNDRVKLFCGAAPSGSPAP
ncbi:PASTA domain-containing protein [Micromonospora sp. NPDC049679]|uniref:PASTA domain-containing protein n=1 Tax=Micromonospora sp. NPDC049679 TaxID=3155920 RepID=UPI0033E11A20